MDVHNPQPQVSQCVTSPAGPHAIPFLLFLENTNQAIL